MIKSNSYFFTLALLTFFVLGCSKDDKPANYGEFVVAFEKQSLGLSAEENAHEIQVVFSTSAPQNGSLQVLFQPNNLVYGTDFTTVPPANNGIIELSAEAGTSGTSFTFTKLTPNPTGNEPEKSVEFSFGKINFPNAISNGNTTLLVTYSESASLGGNFAPNVGGPNQPNQVYVDLSGQTETGVPRDKWDLKFYSGDEFRVKLNSSLYMMAAELQTTDIDAITETDVQNLQPEMAFLVEGSNEFVDAPSGNLNETAIAEISAIPSENKVYLLKMGNEIGTNTPEEPSGVAIAGDPRGWKKIRILRDGNNYILHYADLNATTHQQIIISKSSGFNFTYFNFNSESIVTVEPSKTNWDLNFTVFTEVEELTPTELTAYGYSDYVMTNVYGEVKAYRVSTDDFNYENFSRQDIIEENFIIDQQVIGSSWRDVIPPDRGLFQNIFYVVKDSEGNIYKLQFTALFNENGVRGYPEFQYELLH